MQTETNPLAEKNKEKKSSHGIMKKTFIAVLACFMLIVFSFGAGYLYLFYLLEKFDREMIPRDDSTLGIRDRDFSYDDKAVVWPDSSANEQDQLASLPYYFEGVKGIACIALFGIDAEEGQAGRSDAIMILTIDTNADKIKLTSIIRDSYVNIPGRGMDKINHAYAFGGARLALQTLNSNFHLNIRHYAAVNFTSMPAIIDRLGGIELNITQAEASVIPGVSRSGKVILNGEQSLAFSRIRKIDSDFERARRQRDVMEALIKKMFQMSASSYPDLLSQMLPLVKTNMTSNEILAMGAKVAANNIRAVEQSRYPSGSKARGQLINGIYYYVFDRAETIHQIGKYLYLDQ